MGTDPKNYVVGPDTTIEDVDLDEEEVFLADGARLTEQRAGQIAEEALAEIRRRNLVPGRKSLTGGSAHSPRVQFRVPEALRTPLPLRTDGHGQPWPCLWAAGARTL